MARPVKRKGSPHHQFRQRIPADILRIIAIPPEGWQRPEGWGKAEITISTGARAMPGETEADTYRRIGAEVAATYAMLRNGARDLTDDEVEALAGEAYASVRRPSVGSAKIAKTSSTFTLSGYVDRLAASKGRLLTPASRSKLMARIMGGEGGEGVAIEAVRDMERLEKGQTLGREPSFPIWEASPSAKEGAGPVIRLSKLVELFNSSPRLVGRQPSPAALDRYGTTFRRLTEFLSDPPAREVTEQDLRRFRYHLQTTGVTEANRQSRRRTINANDMAAIKSLFRWASDRDQHDPSAGPLLPSNPALGIKIETAKAQGIVGKEEPGFRDDEIQTILTAALAITIGNEHPARDRALRWVPWIAAYTGRRVSSICDLSVEDFRVVKGVKCIRMPGQKGLQHAALVPLHPHLLEQGLWEAALAIKEGPVFFDPDRRRNTKAKSSPAQHMGQAVAQWVRQDLKITRKGVSPNHGWRSTFFTIAENPEGNGIPIIDAHARYIAGLVIAGVKETFYTRPDTSGFAASIARFPRFIVSASAPAA